MGEPMIPERGSSMLGSSQSRPAPVGVMIKTRIQLAGKQQPLFEMYNLSIAVLEILRGQEVWGRIKAEGVSDDPPKAGFDYVLARITFGYSRQSRVRSDAAPYAIKQGQFVAVSPDGKTEYETPPLIRQPQPQLIDVPFSAGDSREGWIVLQAPQGVKEPLLAFHREYSGDTRYAISGPVWFKLFKFDPMCIDSSCVECR
jgi:hypothetical protein